MELRFNSGKTLQITKDIVDAIAEQLAAGKADWQIFVDNVNPGVGTFLILNMKNVDCIIDKETMHKLSLKKLPASNGQEKKDK